MFWVVTSRMAATAMTAASRPKATFWATSMWVAANTLGMGRGSSLLLGALFDLRPRFQGQGLGHRLHPVAQALHVVEQVGMLDRGVLVLRAPEQGVGGADLHADAAVHAQPVVDVEAVEKLDGPGLPPLPPGGSLVLVALDVDAPVGAAAGAQHADRAVLLLEGDHAPGPGGRLLLDVGVLHGDGPPGHGLERDAEALHQACAGNLGHDLQHHLENA